MVYPDGENGTLLDGAPVELTADVALALDVYDWPCAVREFQHAVSSVRPFARAGRPIDVGFLPTYIQRALRKRAGRSGTPDRADPAAPSAERRRNVVSLDPVAFRT